MGSQPSKSSSQLNNQPQVPPPPEFSQFPTDPPPISRESFDIFLSCLKSLPFSPNNEQLETLIYDISEKTYDAKSLILQLGAEATGIYVVLEGTCNVLASDQTTILRSLQKGDFFGEISSLYDTSCTCSIQSSEELQCRLLCLPVEKVKLLDTQVAPMKDWYFQRKYLDMNNLFPPMEIMKSLVENSMLACPLFRGWSQAALQSVYKDLLPCPVEIYVPPNSIFFPHDQTPCAYLLIYGRIEVFSDKQSIIVEAKNEVVWFGDEQLFCDSPKQLSARALSPCQIITISVDLFAKFNEDYDEYVSLVEIRNLWEQHLRTRDINLYEKYFDIMNIFSLTYQLKRTDIFNFSHSTFLYHVALSLVTRHFDANVTIMVHENNSEMTASESPLLILILTGGCQVMKPDIDSDEHLQPGDIFYFDSSYEEKCHIKTSEDSLVAAISKQQMDSIKLKFPDTLLNIDW